MHDLDASRVLPLHSSATTKCLGKPDVETASTNVESELFFTT